MIKEKEDERRMGKCQKMISVCLHDVQLYISFEFVDFIGICKQNG